MFPLTDVAIVGCLLAGLVLWPTTYALARYLMWRKVHWGVLGLTVLGCAAGVWVVTFFLFRSATVASAVVILTSSGASTAVQMNTPPQD